MITVQIGDIQKDIKDASSRWIHEQLERRRRDGGNVCVQVIIDKPPLNMRLTTPGCQTSSGTRPPNAQEQRIFALWERHRLTESDFSGGNLVAFLKQIS